LRRLDELRIRHCRENTSTYSLKPEIFTNPINFHITTVSQLEMFSNGYQQMKQYIDK
jgi:hypothetical protein